MKHRALYHRLVLVTVVLALLLASNAAASVSGLSTIVRTQEPVVILGSELPAFLGVPVTQLHVYAFDANQWVRLPAQVDEIDLGDKYVELEDGLLDANDQIVFMARDLGELSGGRAPAIGDGSLALSWYEAKVSDPTHSGAQGWAYVVRTGSAPPGGTPDYVSWNAAEHRIMGSNYTLGFESPRPWLDYLALGSSGVDILDRAPKYRFCRALLCLNENLAPDTPDGLVKDGPVRVILREGRIIAYGWMASSEIPLTIPSVVAPDWLRFSVDLNSAATGALYYNQAVPGGVLVDGSPDAVPELPLSTWNQISHSTGTFVHVFDVSELGGAPINYYLDSSAIDNQDSGDKMHFGDSGVRVDMPNLSFTFRTVFYFLNGPQPNVGADYASYYNQPLQVDTQWQQLILPPRQYLPLVLQ